MRTGNIPEISPFQYGAITNGTVGESVNLFRGMVSFRYALFSLPNKNNLGIHLSALYQSDVDKLALRRNQEAPTGIMGLGWHFSYARIQCESSFYLPANLRKYYLSYEQSQLPLYLINETWQRGKLDDSFTKDLNSSGITERLIAAFHGQGLYLGAACIITKSSKDIWRLTDSEYDVIYKLAVVEGGEIHIYDGGLQFEGAGADFSRISYYPELECFRVVHADGITELYGGRGEGTINYGVSWDGWSGPSIHSHSQEGIRVQKQCPKAWNLSKQINIWGDTIEYSYVQSLQRVGAEGLEYTKECYLSKIADFFGNTVVLSYGDKLYQDGAGKKIREYADPQKKRPDGRPDAYQSSYETKYLQSIEGFYPDGTLIQRMEFDYSFAFYTNSSSNPYLEGDCVKRLLSAIRLIMPDGREYPPMSFSYNSIGENNSGAIKCIHYSEGAAITYHYAARNLPNCSSRSLRIPAPYTNGKAKTFVGPNYIAVIWSYTGRNRIALYTWVGKWQLYTAQEAFDYFDYNHINAIVKKDYVLIYGWDTAQSTLQYAVYHMDPDVIGGFIASGSKIIKSPLLSFEGGEDFYVINDPGARSIKGYYWNGPERRWKESPSLIEGYSVNKRYLMTSSEGMLTIIDYDIYNGSNTSLTLYYVNEISGFTRALSITLKDLHIYGVQDRLYYSLSSSAGIIAGSFVTDNYSSSFRYQVYIWNLKAESGTLVQTYKKELLCKSGSVTAAEAALWNVNIISDKLITTGGYLLRFNGETWLENNSLLQQVSEQDTKLKFAYGDDTVLSTQLREHEVVGRALIFDPNRNDEAWNNVPVDLYHATPEKIDKSRYMPTCSASFATWDKNVYNLQINHDTDTPFSAVYKTLPDKVDTSAIVNSSPDFLACLARDAEGNRISSLLYGMKNGEIEYVEEKRELFPAPEAEDEKKPLAEQISACGSAFCTYETQDGEYTSSVTLYYFMGDSITNPVTSYQVVRAEIDDGIDKTGAYYQYDERYAACDETGQFIRYYRVWVFPRLDGKKTNGYTQYDYRNSLVGLRADQNPYLNGALDGQLQTVITYNASDVLVSRLDTEYDMSNKVTNPLTGEERNLHGFYMRSSQSTFFKDGVKTHRSYSYDSSSGNQTQTSFESYNARGEKEILVQKSLYGYKVYPSLWYSNRLKEQILDKNEVWTANGDVFLTQAKAVTYRFWDSDALYSDVSVFDLVKDYKWTGSREGKESFDFYDEESNLSYGWQLEGNINLRSSTGLVLEREAPEGMINSVIYDKRGQVEVANFSLAKLANQEALYYGFEEYEAPLEHWQLAAEAVVDGISHTGKRCLCVKYNTITAPLILQVEPQYNDYIISFWSYNTNSSAVLHIIRESGREAVEIMKSPKWQYHFKKLKLSGRETLRFEFMNQSAEDIYIDNVCFHICEAPPRVMVYDKCGGLLTNMMGGYTEYEDYIYDDYDRRAAQLSKDRTALSLQLPYLTGSAQEAFHTVLYCKPMEWSFYDRFYNRGFWLNDWESEDETQWQSRNGSLLHLAGRGWIRPKKVSLTDDYFVSFSIDNEENNSFELVLGQDLSVRWTKTGWVLSDNGQQITKEAKSCGRSIFLYKANIILLLSDGKCIFNSISTANSKEAFSLCADGKLAIQKFMCGVKPQLGIHFTDKTGKLRQGHSLEGNGMTITQTLYDELARVAVSTKPVYFNYSKACLPFVYRYQFVQSFDWRSGVMLGEVADAYPGDEGYPYVRQLFEDTPTGRLIEKGGAGKTYAINLLNPGECHTEKLSYGTNEITYNILKLPLTQYYVTRSIDADGHVKESYRNTAGALVAELIWLDEAKLEFLLTTTDTVYKKEGIEVRTYLPNYYTGSSEQGQEKFVRIARYNYAGLLLSQEDCDSGKTEVFYDQYKRVRFIQNEMLRMNRTVYYKKYDSFHHLTEEGHFTSEWDEELKKKAFTKPDYPAAEDGAIIGQSYSYHSDDQAVNQLGLLTAIQTFDDRGQLASRYQMEYDNYARMAAKSVYIPGKLQEAITQKYQYDSIDNIISTTYSDGSSIAYEFDNAGRIKTVRDEKEEPVSSFDYYANDLVKSINYGKADKMSYSYNGQGWLTKLESGLIKEELIYEENKDKGPYTGKVSEVGISLKKEQLPEGLPRQMRYKVKYDASGRILGAACFADGVFKPELSFGTNKSIVYDANGNILEFEENNQVTKYTYKKGSNQLTGISDREDLYSYDENGSVIKSIPKEITHIEYSVNTSKPLSFTTPNDKIRLAYDNNQKRLTKESKAVDRIYIHNASGNIMEEIELLGDGTKRTRTFSYSPYGLCCVKEGGKRYFTHLDHLGSVRAMADEEGKALLNLHYTPYGEMLGLEHRSDDGRLHYFFTGYEFDEETGLYYAKSRMYDPSLRRFYSVDPKGEYASPYLYCGNNPFMFTDPTGESSWWAILIGAVLGLALTLVGGIAGCLAVGAIATTSTASAIGLTVTGALAGAAGSIVGTTVTAAIDSEPITGKLLLSSLATGAASGLAGGGIGLLGKGVATAAYVAGKSLTYVKNISLLISGAGAGLAGGLAGGIAGAAVSGDSFLSGKTWMNIAIGACAGMGTGLLVSGAMYSFFGSMPIEYYNGAGQMKNTFSLNEIVTKYPKYNSKANQLFNKKTFLSFVPKDQIESTGISMLKNNINPFNSNGSSDVATDTIIAVHGFGRMVFPVIADSQGRGSHMMIMYQKQFTKLLMQEYGSQLGGNTPVKLFICFSAFGYKRNCTAQVLASALRRETYGTRGVTYPGEDNKYLNFHF